MALNNVEDVFGPPPSFDPYGLDNGKRAVLQAGSGKDIWQLADRMRGFQMEIPLSNASDIRFLERANALIDACRAKVSGQYKDFLGDPTAVVSPSNLQPLRVLLHVFGPELAYALLLRLGVAPGFAGSALSEALEDPIWGESQESQRRRRTNEFGRIPVKTAGGADLCDLFPGAASADHLRTIAGLDREWVTLPSEMLGSIWGVSVAFEEGLPEHVVGIMRRTQQLGSEAEIVIRPEVENSERILGAMLIGWLEQKSGEAPLKDVRLTQHDLVADHGERGVVGTMLAGADWLVIGPQRLVEELRRVGAGGFSDRAALIAMDLYLPQDLVARSVARIQKAILRQAIRF